jgi:hypothetical protein
VAYFVCALVNGPDINSIRSLADMTCSVSSDWLARGDSKCQQIPQQTDTSERRETKQREEKETSKNEEDLGHWGPDRQAEVVRHEDLGHCRSVRFPGQAEVFRHKDLGQ